MRNKLPLVLSITAVVIAVFGSTPVGGAAQQVIQGLDADTVDGKHAVGAGASASKRAGKLVATDGNGEFPRGALRGSVSGIEAVWKESSANANEHKVVQAVCPSGKVALGGSVSPSGLDGAEAAYDRVGSSAISDASGPIGWVGSANAAASFMAQPEYATEGWSLAVSVVCAKVSD